MNAYEQASNLLNNSSSSSLPDPMEIGGLDTRWADDTLARNTTDRTKLEVELKTYTNNTIKEGTRVGDYAIVLKHYTKSREFCATGAHVLEMCLSVLELLIEQRNYSHLMTYVFKADAALDAATAAASTAGNGGGNWSGSTVPTGALPKKKPVSAERDSVQSKLDFATVLSHLRQGTYEKAAQYLLNLGAPRELGEWIDKVCPALISQLDPYLLATWWP
ncbi:hypothetical protein D9611_011788 [Ephemerocybe angulata]|uniref:26S proteasome regulatory subunit Rpn7 N-terminal domain-containing protein n=1 Tax=Ephemerocybe angulata TaxID=980116 RepID=A0A8H5FG35_9AGAR|nr:hypothetical protein D9611_011788 [Tulosesus angulatus]